MAKSLVSCFFDSRCTTPPSPHVAKRLYGTEQTWRLHLPLYCVTRKFGFLQNRGIFLWSSALSQTLDLAIFCHGKSINRTFRQSSSLPQWLDGPGTKSAVYDRPPYSLLHCFPVGRRLIRYSFDQSLIWSACVAWDDVLAWTIVRTCWSTFQLQSLSQQSVQIPPDSDTRTCTIRTIQPIFGTPIKFSPYSRSWHVLLQDGPKNGHGLVTIILSNLNRSKIITLEDSRVNL